MNKRKGCIPNLNEDDIHQLEALLLSNNDPDADYTVKTAASEGLDTINRGGQNAPEGSKLTSKGESET